MTKRGSAVSVIGRASATFPRDDKEAAFFAAITRSPSDEEARSVYADWLEERSDTAYAESLRIDAMLAGSGGDSCAEIKTLAKRLSTLRAKTAPDWRTAVLRWSTEKDFTPFALKDAIAKIKTSKHAGAPKVAKVVRDWVESMMDEDDSDDPYGIVRVYERNVAVAGDFETSMSAVVVLGDLAVGKQYTDLIESDQSLLAVAGDMHCGSIWELGELFVAGSIDCEGAFYGSSYQTNRGEVLGDVKARALIENHHHFVIHGRLEATARIGDSIRVKGRYLPGNGDLDKLVPDVTDGDGGIDEGKLYKRICAEQDVLVGATKARPSASKKKPHSQRTSSK